MMAVQIAKIVRPSGEKLAKDDLLELDERGVAPFGSHTQQHALPAVQ
jgi:hypothetical protein